MKGLGIIVVMSFVVLTIAIFISTCTDWSYTEECFKGSQGQVADLPAASASLAENNSLPYNDPAEEKSMTQMLTVLKADMDGFSSSELPGLMEVGKNDPSVKLPVTRFKGDYQRVKDELLTVKNNPGLEPQITIDDVQEIAANLRFLQRTYRTYSASNMVPPPVGGVSTVGEGFSKEGFSNPEGFTDTPITVDQLNTLSTKLSVEIARLLASGSTDPVIKARTSAFTKVRQSIDDINSRIKNGTLDPKAIPIMTKDYQNFLPALGSNSAGIAGILSASGNSTLSSLFNSYDMGDISGSEVAAALFERYADELLKGLSYKVTVGYTSPNDVSKEQAIASAWSSKRAFAALDTQGGTLSEANGILHPGLDGFRGDFDKTVRSLDLVGFSDSGSVRPPAKAPTEIGSFDWKERADQITENIRRARLNPADYGCLARGAQVSADYSWRGHAKMVCSRLATNADPGIPEQMGCPPVSWKGWRV
jgi:hypothetical protein